MTIAPIGVSNAKLNYQAVAAGDRPSDAGRYRARNSAVDDGAGHA
jgi:hypothetical protein